MRHEQYTCDRCHEKIDSERHSGDWVFTIGHTQYMRRIVFGSSDLCAECKVQIVEATSALWKALWPKLVKPEK